MWPWTVTCGLDHLTTEFDLESVKMNQSVKCIGQRSRFLKIYRTGRHTQSIDCSTWTTKWSVVMTKRALIAAAYNQSYPETFLRTMRPPNTMCSKYGRHQTDGSNKKGITANPFPLMVSVSRLKSVYTNSIIVQVLSKSTQQQLNRSNVTVYTSAKARVASAAIWRISMSSRSMSVNHFPHFPIVTHNFVGLYLRNQGTYRQSEKKLVKQQYRLHMSP